MEINNTITVPKPALSPKILVRRYRPSSGVEGIAKSDTAIFSGIANLITLTPALIENNDNSTKEAILACFLDLENEYEHLFLKLHHESIQLRSQFQKKQ